LLDQRLARRCLIGALCCSIVLIGATVMLGRLAPSRQAAASTASFFLPPLT
jgi:hypothetical protein